MREWVRVAAYPVLLIGPLVALQWGLVRGVPAEKLVVSLLLAVAGVLLVLQRLMAYEERWRSWHRDVGVDLLHAVFSMGLVSAAVESVLFGIAFTVSVSLTTAWGGTLWPAHWPLVVQLPFALVIGELGTYLLHRASHETQLLWRIHALHHSSERLYLLSSSRNHPISTALAYLVGTIPILLLGAPSELLAMVAVFTGTHGMLQHANVDFRLGPLNWVFSTADRHRWHHSTVIEESCSNYGSNLIVWDLVFGTAFLPKGRRVRAVGLGEESRFPKGFVGQLLSPFTLP